jgi:hypothetical protein
MVVHIYGKYLSLQISIYKHEISYLKYLSVNYDLIYICLPSCDGLDLLTTICVQVKNEWSCKATLPTRRHALRKDIFIFKFFSLINPLKTKCICFT